ncbi:MAG: ABC transporter permease [SAR324 cluster bacterium]|nr:ABC transporter permease [SAR324 cluster bacterium]
MFDLQGYFPSLMEGLLLTISLSFFSLFFAMILGICGALGKLSSYKILQKIMNGYTTIVRGIPELVLMLLLFFGGQMMINQLAEMVGYEEYIDVNPYFAGIVTIGFIYGAYMAETFRGAIMSVSKGQLEAGRAYGMSGRQVFIRILFPQMIRHAIPGFGNNWLVLLKATALVSVIGLDDIVRKAALAAGATKMPFTFYLMVAVCYLVMTSISVLLLSRLEKKYSVGVRTV